MTAALTREVLVTETLISRDVDDRDDKGREEHTR